MIRARTGRAVLRATALQATALQATAPATAPRATALRAPTLLTLIVVAGASIGALSACKGIDKSQWSSSYRTGAAGSGSASRTVAATPPSTGDLGITSGSNAGTRSGSSAKVVIAAPEDTCWSLTLDGLTHRGCGNATFTDSRGTAAARVTKTRGAGSVTLTLQAGGQTVDTGTVSIASRFVTVVQPEPR